MQPITVDIDCVGYAVKADIYHGSENGAVLLVLIGRTSKRTKQRYRNFLSQLATELGITAVIFDYSGHGDSPFNIEDIRPAQHFLEVVTVFDWIREKFPDRMQFVEGSSYGGYLATLLTQYRKFDGLVLRAPAIYKPSVFYTARGHENNEATRAFRHNAEDLAKHPYLLQASKYTGKALLVIHENDDQIPKETTDAYAKALKPTVTLAESLTHSLDDATEQQINEYNQQIFDWLANYTSH